MQVRKRLTLITASAAITGGLALAPIASASAEPAPAKRTTVTAQQQEADATAQAAPRNCPRGYLCVYPKANYKGQVKKVKDKNANLQRYGGAFNKPKSAYNNGTQCKKAVVYRYKNFGEPAYTLNKQTGWRNIGSNLPTIWSNSWTGC